MTTTSTAEHHAPPVAVAVVRDDTTPATWERVLAAITRIVVIITCTVVLYTLYRAYVLAAAVADALDEFGRSFNGLGI